MNDAVNAIEAMMADPDTSLDDESRLIARRASLHAQINNQSLIQAHLKASKIIVDFDPNDARGLDELDTEMDGFIVSGLKISAMLTLVPKSLTRRLESAMRSRHIRGRVDWPVIIWILRAG